MGNGLRVAPQLTLPREIAVEKNAILAMSGAGKSNAAVVLAEAMYDAGIPWVAVDPKGDWWGVRSSRGGAARGGLQIPILGGLHGDVPLESTAGTIVANLIVDKRLTCVLDISEFDTRQEMFRFLADFAETLLKRNREPLHVFAEEADDYLPQRTVEKGALLRCLGNWQRLVKRGRQRGIGSTLITQRSSAINKDVLNMTDTLIVMRTAATLDRKAVKDWVNVKGGNPELVDSLPELADGEAWVWSPQKLKLTKRIRFDRRRTYDSGATPMFDAKAKVTTLADVDFDALTAQMAETIERAAADDPEKLRARIRELEKQGEKVREVQVPVVQIEHVEVVPEWMKGELIALVDAFGPIAGEMQNLKARVATIADRMATELPRTSGSEPARAKGRSAHKPVASPPATRATHSAERGGVAVVPLPPIKGGDVGKGPSTILGVLYQHGGTMEKARLRLLTGQARSTFDRYALTLRQQGLVNEGDPMSLTPEGTVAAPEVEMMPPPGDALFRWWCSHPKVGVGPRSILVALRDTGGYASKDVLRESVGQARSTFDRYFLTLRQLGIVSVTGSMASLMEDLR